MRRPGSLAGGLVGCVATLAAAALLVPPGNRAAETAVPYQAAGTRRMAERLQRIADGSNPLHNPFLNRRRVEVLRGRMADWASRPTTVEGLTKRYRGQLNYANELLKAGQTEAAIQQLQELEALLIAQHAYGAQPKNLLRPVLATAYLRLGEQENCGARHTSESCLLPIRGQGVHSEQRGSRGAIEVLTRHLKEFPADLRARWLLNIAAMTVGEYPDQVPAAWLIPPGHFESDYPLQRFPEVAPLVGLDLDSLAGGVIMDDFDGDGSLDLVMSSMGVDDPIRFFRNNGDGSFSERSVESGLLGEVGGLNLVSTDYNNDGHLDFMILRGGWMGRGGHYPNSLLRNNGDGTFDDVTEEAGLLRSRPTQTATWFDFNGDGWLDVFIASETIGGDEPQPCSLFRNDGDGTFTDIAPESGLTSYLGVLKAVVNGDYNNDGRPDLYISWHGHDNLLLRNDGPADAARGSKSAWKFTEVASAAGVTEPFHSFPAWFFDYDNDGWLDLFASGYNIEDVGDVAADLLGLPTQAERVRLFHNSGNGSFADVTRQAGLFKVIHTMGSNFGDLDNDGWLDFYLSTGNPNLSTLIPNRMFRSAEGRFFQDVTTAGGFGHLQKGHGVAFGDLDNDGDQDIYHVLGGAYEGDNYRNALWENPGHPARWLTLKLEGTRSNRAAIGARIRVVVDTPQGERQIFRTVGSGGSFGCSPLRAEIGLGDARSIRALEIFWPATGGTQTISNLALDRFYTIREGDPLATEWRPRRFRLVPDAPAAAPAHVHSAP